MCRSYEWVATDMDNLAATAKRMVSLSTDVRGARVGAARVDFCGWEGDKPDMRMLTTGSSGLLAIPQSVQQK